MNTAMKRETVDFSIKVENGVVKVGNIAEE